MLIHITIINIPTIKKVQSLGLQALSINIEDYKKEGQRYKIGEKNGEGKEYLLDSNELIFEGNYLNGIRWNGKGKKYNNYGKLTFEGVYINGKKNGKGKKYNKNGNLIFEGDYLNGK